MVNSSEKTKILLVDDDEMIRIYFRDVLWIHGLESKCEITIVGSVAEAEKIINDPQKRPQIIFLDLVMPIEKDGRKIVSPEAGFKFLKKIKADENLKKIKVIIFSSHSEESLKEKAKRLGAEDYIVKGTHLPKELAGEIEKIVNK